MRKKFRGYTIEDNQKYFLVYHPDNSFFGRFSRYTSVIGAITAQWKRLYGVRD